MTETTQTTATCRLNANDLQKALKPLVVAKHTLPVLNSIRISMNAETGTIAFTTINEDRTNDTTSIKCGDGSITDNIEVAIDNAFIPVLKSFKGKDSYITLSVSTDGACSIYHDGNDTPAFTKKYTAFTEDYPTSISGAVYNRDSARSYLSAFTNVDACIQLTAKQIQRLLKFTSKEVYRPAMQGICLHNDKAVASDGYRLCVIQHGYKMPEEYMDNMPILGVRRKQQFAHDAYDIILYSDESGAPKYFAMIPDSKTADSPIQHIITGALIDEKFPNYENVIPKGNDVCFKLNGKDVVEIVGSQHKLSGRKSPHTTRLRFSIPDLDQNQHVYIGDLTISTSDVETGEVVATSKTTVELDQSTIKALRDRVKDEVMHYEIGFNPVYLMEGMEAMLDTFSTIYLRLDTPTRAALLCFAPSPERATVSGMYHLDTLTLVMPMRLS